MRSDKDRLSATLDELGTILLGMAFIDDNALNVVCEAIAHVRQEHDIPRGDLDPSPKPETVKQARDIYADFINRMVPPQLNDEIRRMLLVLADVENAFIWAAHRRLPSISTVGSMRSDRHVVVVRQLFTLKGTSKNRSRC
jgi:hypothetical protein